MRRRPLLVLLALLLALPACARHKPPEYYGPASVSAATMRAALAAPHRRPEDRARDVYRHPTDTLTFFGLREDMTVVELWPGNGWYTDILAPLLRERGTLIAATPDPAGSHELRATTARALRERVASNPSVYGDVTFTVLDTDRMDLGQPGSADLVLTFRNTHNWINDGIDEKVYAAAYRVLKPGGVLGVVQHRADEGTDAATAAKKGYVPEDHVIAVAEAAGFVLEERSEVNANPRDTKDYTDGVWALPPVLRGGEWDRARFLAIGESDRMTLRFVKPTS
jgi:predicted methyltransferase